MLDAILKEALPLLPVSMKVPNYGCTAFTLTDTDGSVHMGLSGLSLTAHPGDIIGITGPVACGKSTLGRVFLCEAPYQGSACFGGREFSVLTPRQIAA